MVPNRATVPSLCAIPWGIEFLSCCGCDFNQGRTKYLAVDKKGAMEPGRTISKAPRPGDELRHTRHLPEDVRSVWGYSPFSVSSEHSAEGRAIYWNVP